MTINDRLRLRKDIIRGRAEDERGQSPLSSGVLIRAWLPVIGCPSGLVLEQHLEVRHIHHHWHIIVDKYLTSIRRQRYRLSLL